MRNPFTALIMGAAIMAAPAFAHEAPGKPAPQLSQSLAISGAVNKPVTLSVADLMKLPDIQIRDIELATRGGKVLRQLKAVKGVRLRDLLTTADIQSKDHNDVKKTIVIAGATDGYKVIFSYEELFNSANGDGVLVFFEADGKPLSEDGEIALISANDIRTGPRHVKWLSTISVVRVTE